MAINAISFRVHILCAVLEQYCIKHTVVLEERYLDSSVNIVYRINYRFFQQQKNKYTMSIN